MNRMMSREQVQRIREKYPPGTRIRLHHMADAQAVRQGTVLCLEPIKTQPETENSPLYYCLSLGKAGFRRFILRNAGAEAAEEGASDLLNWIIDDLYDLATGTTESEFKQLVAVYEENGLDRTKALLSTLGDRGKELGLDILGGALSGLFLSGAKGGYNAIQFNRMGQEALDTGSYRDYISLGLLADHGSEAYRYAEEIRDKLNAGRAVTNIEMGQLTAAVYADALGVGDKRSEDAREEADEKRYFCIVKEPRGLPPGSLVCVFRRQEGDIGCFPRLFCVQALQGEAPIRPGSGDAVGDDAVPVRQTQVPEGGIQDMEVQRVVQPQVGEVEPAVSVAHGHGQEGDIPLRRVPVQEDQVDAALHHGPGLIFPHQEPVDAPHQHAALTKTDPVPRFLLPLDDLQHIYPAPGAGAVEVVFQPWVRSGVGFVLGEARPRLGKVFLRGDDEHRFGGFQELGIIVYHLVQVGAHIQLVGVQAAVVFLQGLRSRAAVFPVQPQGGQYQGQAQDGRQHPQEPGAVLLFHKDCPLSAPSVQFDAASMSRKIFPETEIFRFGE